MRQNQAFRWLSAVSHTLSTSQGQATPLQPPGTLVYFYSPQLISFHSMPLEPIATDQQQGGFLATSKKNNPKPKPNKQSRQQPTNPQKKRKQQILNETNTNPNKIPRKQNKTKDRPGTIFSHPNQDNKQNKKIFLKTSNLYHSRSSENQTRHGRQWQSRSAVPSAGQSCDLERQHQAHIKSVSLPSPANHRGQIPGAIPHQSHHPDGFGCNNSHIWIKLTGFVGLASSLFSVILPIFLHQSQLF